MFFTNISKNIFKVHLLGIFFRKGSGKANLLIPIRSAKLCGALKHEKHRGGLPCGWGREAPKERWRMT